MFYRVAGIKYNDSEMKIECSTEKKKQHQQQQQQQQQRQHHLYFKVWNNDFSLSYNLCLRERISHIILLLLVFFHAVQNMPHKVRGNSLK